MSSEDVRVFQGEEDDIGVGTVEICGGIVMGIPIVELRCERNGADIELVKIQLTQAQAGRIGKALLDASKDVTMPVVSRGEGDNN